MSQAVTPYSRVVHFRRSDTIVTDDLLTIGAREFSMRDILSAQVFDITAGNYLVDAAFKKKATAMNRWISGIAALGFLSSLFTDRTTFPGSMIFALSLILLCLTQLLSNWVVPGYRPFFRRHEYYLTLNLREGSEDVISAYDLPYIESIAKEINSRVPTTNMVNARASSA